MKKVLFPIVALATMGVSAQVGTFVADGALVHVHGKTHFFSKNGLNVQQQTLAANGFESQGYVTLEGPVEGAAVNGEFIRFDYNDESNSNANVEYGQLIIKSTAANSTGEISIKTDIMKNQASSTSIGFALPFTNGFLDVLNSTAGTSLTALNTGRYTATAYYFDNYWYTPMQVGLGWSAIKSSNANIRPEFLYSVVQDRMNTSALITDTYIRGGVPNHKSFTYNLKAPTVRSSNTYGNAGKPLELITNLGMPENQDKNVHGERYNIVTDDPMAAPTDADWGHSAFRFGNPYTSNFNLTKFFADSGITTSQLKGLFFDNVEIKNGENYYTTKVLMLTCANTGGAINSNTCTGDLAANGSIALTVKPGMAFGFKMRDGALATFNTAINNYQFTNYTLQFNDSQKTYDYTGLVTNVNTGSTVTNTDNAQYLKQAKNFKNAVSQANTVEELKLLLAEDNKIEAHAYITANPFAQTTDELVADTQMDVTQTNASARLSSLDEAGSGKALFINGFDMNKFVAKPINVKLSGNIEGKQYNLLGTVRIDQESNLNNSKFYLEDKVTKQLVRIGSDFNYAFTATSNDENRFAVYYGKPDLKTTNAVVDEVTASTTTNSSAFDVAKDSSNNTDYIIFKGMSGKAKVYVYNILGQLVLVDENVSMSQNYSLAKLPSNSGVYVVKVITDSGKTLTKKIIK